MATAREQLAQFAAGSKALGRLCREYKNRSATVHLEELVGGALSFYAAAAVAESGGVHVFVAEDRDAAAYLLNDFYNLLDVRHGPVVMIDERTFVFAFLESAGQTEQALLEDLRKRTGYVVSLGPFAAAEGEDTHFDTGEITDPVAAAIPALYLLQNVALYKALKRGVDPDRPNGLSAWIRL